MNERIQELILQASKDYDYHPEFAEKLVELIVRECMTKVSEWDIGIDDPVGATDNTSEVARDIVAEIKKHFGIE